MTSKFTDLILTASSKTAVPTKKVFDMFYLLLRDGEIENNQLLAMLGVSKNALNQVKENLQELLEPPTSKTSLSDYGKDLSTKYFKEDYRLEEQLLELDIKSLSPQFTTILEQARESLQIAKRDFDQFFATGETVLKRTSLMDFMQDIENKRILLIGDDDFLSLSLGFLKKAQQITVLDIDQEILNTVKDLADKNGLKIQTILSDVNEELLSELKGQFDVVFTDPPYTNNGVTLFLSRAVEAINRENLAARIYFCFGNSDRARERFLPIYKTILDLGLFTRYMFDKFNRYQGAESIGNSSTLFVTELTDKTKPLIQGIYKEAIYTNS